MITKTPLYLTSDEMPFTTLVEAQRHELADLLKDSPTATGLTGVIDYIIQNAEAVIEILRATGRKPRERKKKPGRPKGSRAKAVAANGEPVNNQPKEQ